MQPLPCVLSASPAPSSLLGFAGFCTLCQSAHMGVVTALWGGFVVVNYGSPCL